MTTHSIPATDIEWFVKKVAKLSGEDVDWHYFGGTAVIKTTGNPTLVRRALEKLMPEHDKLMERQFANLGVDAPKGKILI